MSALTVIARLKARSGSEEELARALQSLLAPTRAEAGCITYDLHRSHEDPGLFVFTESWASREAWEAHMKTPHLAEFSARQPLLAESWDLFTGEKIG